MQPTSSHSIDVARQINTLTAT